MLVLPMLTWCSQPRPLGAVARVAIPAVTIAREIHDEDDGVRTAQGLTVIRPSHPPRSGWVAP